MHAVTEQIADFDSTFHRSGMSSEAIDHWNVHLTTDFDARLDVLQSVFGEPQAAQRYRYIEFPLPSTSGLWIDGRWCDEYAFGLVVLGANEPDNVFQIGGILLNRNLALVRWLLTTNFTDRLYRLDGTNLSIHT